MKLIVGLGNPGKEYQGSRHNVGFDAVSLFARKNKISLSSKMSHARVGQGFILKAHPEGEVSGIPVVLAKPFTFMNRSGNAVKTLKNKFSIEVGDLIVVHDDMDLPLGKIRVRVDGSSAGHKGIESIVSELGEKDFIRIRIGIGHPVNGETDSSRGFIPREIREEKEVIDYVLTPFTPEEKKVMEEVFSRVSEAIHCILTEGVEAAMNQFN